MFEFSQYTVSSKLGVGAGTAAFFLPGAGVFHAHDAAAQHCSFIPYSAMV
jgi:hypothetical protein